MYIHALHSSLDVLRLIFSMICAIYMPFVIFGLVKGGGERSKEGGALLSDLCTLASKSECRRSLSLLLYTLV